MIRLKNIYCPECGRFLGREDLRKGRIEIKCSNCKGWAIIIARETSSNIAGILPQEEDFAQRPVIDNNLKKGSNVDKGVKDAS